MIRANMGAIFLQHGDYATCRTHTLEALSLARAIESAWMTAAALHVLGTTSIYMREESLALQYLSEATHLTRQIGSEAFLTSLLPDYALILYRRGQSQQALALLGLALSHPACEADTRLEIEKIVRAWGVGLDFVEIARLGAGMDLLGEIDRLQALG